MRTRIHGSAINLFTEDGVERPGPGKAPTAFRIWKAGMNKTDKGDTVLSEASLTSLTDHQSERANLVSIDVDHLSLSPTAPPESRKAVGWHRLEARGGELWAVDVEWTDAVRAGLEKDPPEWRYFSPAYDVDKKTREVVAYTNTALTNNPATWRVTALASAGAESKEIAMNEKEKCAAALAAWAGDDDDKKKQADAMLKAAFPDEAEEPKKDEPKKDAEEPAKEEPKKDEPKADKVAATAETASLLATIGEQDRRIKALEKTREEDTRTTILASRTDLTENQLKTLRTKPVGELKELLALIPIQAVKPNGATSVTATRGAGQTDDGAPRLPPEEKADLDKRMGLSPRRDSVRREGNSMVFGVLTPSEADALVTKKNKEGAAQ